MTILRPGRIPAETVSGKDSEKSKAPLPENFVITAIATVSTLICVISALSIIASIKESGILRGSSKRDKESEARLRGLSAHDYANSFIGRAIELSENTEMNRIAFVLKNIKTNLETKVIHAADGPVLECMFVGARGGQGFKHYTEKDLRNENGAFESEEESNAKYGCLKEAQAKLIAKCDDMDKKLTHIFMDLKIDQDALRKILLPDQTLSNPWPIGTDLLDKIIRFLYEEKRKKGPYEIRYERLKPAVCHGSVAAISESIAVLYGFDTEVRELRGNFNRAARLDPHLCLAISVDKRFGEFSKKCDEVKMKYLCISRLVSSMICAGVEPSKSLNMFFFMPNDANTLSSVPYHSNIGCGIYGKVLRKHVRKDPEVAEMITKEDKKLFQGYMNIARKITDPIRMNRIQQFCAGLYSPLICPLGEELKFTDLMGLLTINQQEAKYLLPKEALRRIKNKVDLETEVRYLKKTNKGYKLNVEELAKTHGNIKHIKITGLGSSLVKDRETALIIDTILSSEAYKDLSSITKENFDKEIVPLVVEQKSLFPFAYKKDLEN